MDIFEAIGVGGAAGLSPMVAIAALVLFAAVHLGIDPKSTDVSFVTGAAAVVVALIVLLQSFFILALPGSSKARIAADRPQLMPLHVVVALVLGALSGALVYSAEGHGEVVGAILGAFPAALVAYGSGGLLKGVVARLSASRDKAIVEAKEKADEQTPEKGDGSTRVLAFGVDVTAILVVLGSLLAPPIGLIAPVLATLIIFGTRRRAAKKHEGLRVLR